MKVIVGVSNRHVHLNKETYEKLFKKELTKFRDLDQPTQFAANEKVSIKVNNIKMDNIRIVGPLREYNQIEISLTDAYKLKVKPPIRTSGNLKGSLPVTIIGPKGSVDLKEGLIIADRHIHITKQQMKKYNLKEKENLAVKVNGEKSGILKNVHLKVLDNSNLRLHLDTDDANSLGLKTGDEVEILRIKEGNNETKK
ncbi:MAG: phosphate propanoyltransferase [Bacilli bacterium]|nr:phosphate propanoyltransferase [Bacilli bacterium]